MIVVVFFAPTAPAHGPQNPNSGRLYFEAIVQVALRGVATKYVEKSNQPHSTTPPFDTSGACNK